MVWQEVKVNNLGFEKLIDMHKEDLDFKDGIHKHGFCFRFT